MELDTGVAVSVMSEQQRKALTNGELVKPYQGKPLQNYSGHEVRVVRKVDVNVENDRQLVQLPVLIEERNTNQLCLAVTGLLLSS